MKNKCLKLAAIVMMLAVALTGCSLIEIDPVMQLEEDIATLKAEYAKPLATYNGGEITVGDIAYQYSSEYSYLSYLYSMYGYTMTEEDAELMLEDIVKSNMDTRAMLLHTEEYGVSITEEEKAECLAEAEEAYNTDYETAYASAEGETEELKKLQTEYDMLAMGQTMEVYIHQREWTVLLEKMEEVIGQDITEIPEDELEMLLIELAIEDEQTYTGDLGSYESAQLDPDTCVVWNPNGYRTVKHILVMADDDLVTEATDIRTALSDAKEALSELESEQRKANAAEPDDDSHRSTEEIQADIEATTAEIETLTADSAAADAAVVATVQDKLDEIYAKLDAGEDFDAVMAEYGEDPGMQSDPAMTKGYYVSAESPTWDPNFRDNAMMLANIGDYSAEPVVSSSGVHIIYYNSDIVGGQMQLEDIREEFLPRALDTTREEYMLEKVTGWVNELKPVYTIDNFLAGE